MTLTALQLWLLTVIISIAFSLSYYSYLALKRRFDSVYGERFLVKRAIHGIVYILFLVLANEAIRIKVAYGEYSLALEFLLYLLLGSVGVPIFIDIILSMYKVFRRGR